MNINFTTSNLIIACYIRGAGGKFILNCLGISKHVALQHRDFAYQQLTGQLSSKDKHDILLERINETGQNWNDLGLGCLELFGDLLYKPGKTRQQFEFHPIVNDISNSKLKFCLASHDYVYLSNELEIWPNASCILFENAMPFIRQVRASSIWSIPSAVDLCWANIRGSNWPISAPQNLQEYNKLPAFIRSEIAKLHGDEIIKYYNLQDQEQKIKKNVIKSQACQIWNCNWFLSRALFEDNIQKLYNNLNLDDFDADLIMSFYDAWINKLNIIEQHAGLV